MPQMQLSRLIPFTLCLLFAACGDAAKAPVVAGTTQAASTASVADIPCFEGKGPVVLRIQGVPVDEATVQRYETIMRQRTSGMADSALRRKTIEDALVPMAALYAGYKDRIPEMSRRARLAEDRLARGDSFEAVAIDTGDDLSARSGGVYGTVARSTPGMSTLPPVVEDRVFGAMVGTPTAAFAGLVGFQILRVDKVIPGTTEQRELRMILIHYDALMAKRLRALDTQNPRAKEYLEAWQAEFTEKSRRLIQDAKVEVVDPAWAGLVYPYRLAK